MHLFYLFSVWLHIVAAAVWIGGMVFLGVVLVPVIRRPESRDIAASLFQWTGRRFRWVGWVCLILLLLSGTFNLAYRGLDWSDLWSGEIWQGPFGRALAFKLLVLFLVLLLSALHDFVMGPRATALWQRNPASEEAMRLRRQVSWIGRLNLFLALVMVALGIVLVRGWPW